MSDYEIKDFLIADMVINEFRLIGGDLLLQFTHYNDQEFECLLIGCDYIHEKGGLGFSLDHGIFKENQQGHRWSFFDDQGLVLELRFKKYQIRSVQDSG